MRLQQIRTELGDYEPQHMLTQHGAGIRDVARSLGRFGRKSVSWMIKNASDLALLAKSGYDIYQGRDPSSLVSTLQKASKRVGRQEGDALLRLINKKRKEVEKSTGKDKIEAKKELKQLEVVKKMDEKEDLLAQIRAGKPLKKTVRTSLQVKSKKPSTTKPVSFIVRNTIRKVFKKNSSYKTI